MANTCFGDVYFQGNAEKLKGLIDVFESFEKERIYFDEKLNERINLSYEGSTGMVTSYNYDGKNVLYITFEFAWDDHRLFLNALAELLDSKWSGFFDNDELWKIDPLGFFKTENYLVDIYDTNNIGLPTDVYEFFENEKEVEEFLNQKCNERLTYDEWKEMLCDSDFGIIKEVDEDSL